MQGKDFVKLGYILKNIENKKIDFCILSNGEVFACIDKKIYNFKNLRKFVKDLIFLKNANFSPKALASLDKEKTTKKKEIFLYWVGNCVNYGHQKSRTLEGLRKEFNQLYNVELKQGRKKGSKGASKETHRTECAEQA